MQRLNLHIAAIAFALLITAACGRQDEEAAGGSEEPTIPIISETWLTERNEADNVDSPAIWHGPNGEHWGIATCKSTDHLQVIDAATGTILRRVGTTGDGLGEMRRPNGVIVADDLAIVIERDNHRVQVFRLPDWEAVAVFGADVLIKPYGAAARRRGDEFLLYVTDNYETADEKVPADSLLGKRVKIFALTESNGSLSGRHVSSFGATSGEGVLHVVESIAIDTMQHRILLADEDERYNDIKVYDFGGRYTGRLMGQGLFRYQPEGIVLYSCDNGEGYWVTTDQDENDNTFHVFDRVGLQHLGSFKAAETANTDGIALTQRSFGSFAGGALLAVHNDGNVGALDWNAIADSLDLTLTCPDAQH